jgi:hypothetical protein
LFSLKVLGLLAPALADFGDFLGFEFEKFWFRWIMEMLLRDLVPLSIGLLLVLELTCKWASLGRDNWSKRDMETALPDELLLVIVLVGLVLDVIIRFVMVGMRSVLLR